jgi:hypothetical protein
MITARTPLAQRSVEELLTAADIVDAMSITATTAGVKQALQRLATRYRGLAAKRVAERGDDNTRPLK